MGKNRKRRYRIPPYVKRIVWILRNRGIEITPYEAISWLKDVREDKELLTYSLREISDEVDRSPALLHELQKRFGW